MLSAEHFLQFALRAEYITHAERDGVMRALSFSKALFCFVFVGMSCVNGVGAAQTPPKAATAPTAEMAERVVEAANLWLTAIPLMRAHAYAAAIPMFEKSCM